MREITIRVPEFTLRNVILFALMLGGAGFIWYYKGRTLEPEHIHQESESGPRRNRSPHNRSTAQR